MTKNDPGSSHHSRDWNENKAFSAHRCTSELRDEVKNEDERKTQQHRSGVKRSFRVIGGVTEYSRRRGSVRGT